MDRSLVPRRMDAVGLAVAGVLLAGCEGAGALGDEAACADPEPRPDEGHHHLVGDAEPPVPYGTSPPTSGYHPRDVGAELLGVHAQPLTEPEQVGVLAVGGAVVSHGNLGDGERDALAAVVDDLDQPVALTPYEALDDGGVVFTAWGVEQRCEGVDAEELRAFVADHAAEEADFSMGGHDASDHDHDDEAD